MGNCKMVHFGEESSNGSHRLFQTIAAKKPEGEVSHFSLREKGCQWCTIQDETGHWEVRVPRCQKKR